MALFKPANLAEAAFLSVYSKIRMSLTLLKIVTTHIVQDSLCMSHCIMTVFLCYITTCLISILLPLVEKGKCYMRNSQCIHIRSVFTKIHKKVGLNRILHFSHTFVCYSIFRLTVNDEENIYEKSKNNV